MDKIVLVSAADGLNPRCMAAVCAFRTRCLGPKSAACLDPRYTPASLVIAYHRGQLPAALHGCGSSSQNIVSLVVFRGQDKPALYGRTLQHGSCREHHQAVLHGRGLFVPNGLLGPESAGRLCPQCTPAFHQFHSTLSTYLAQTFITST